MDTLTVVREALEDYLRTGELAPRFFTDDVAFHTRAELAGSEVYRGLDDVRRGAAAFGDVWAELRGDLRDLRASGDRAAAEIHFDLRSHAGVELEAVEGWSYRVREGRICEIRQHATPEEAFATLG